MTWFLTLLVVILLLAILGTMREVVSLRSELASFQQLVTTPPEPQWFRQGRLPAELVKLHSRQINSPEQELILVFVSSSCPGCRKLIDDLTRQNKTLNANGLLFILNDRVSEDGPPPALLKPIQEAGYQVVLDENNDLLFAAGVHGTPTALAMNRERATNYEPGVAAEWIMGRLEEDRELV